MPSFLEIFTVKKRTVKANSSGVVGDVFLLDFYVEKPSSFIFCQYIQYGIPGSES